MSPVAVPTSEGRELDVFTFGEVMALLRADDGLPLAHAGSFRRDVAGAEGNVAIGLARLGHRVHLVLRLGTDAFGDAVAATFRSEGVGLTVIHDPDRPTGLLLRDVLDSRPITVVYHRAGSAASALVPADLDLERVGRARVLHVTGITPVLGAGAAEATLAAVTAARRAGTLVTFDPNLRPSLAAAEIAVARWLALLEQTDIVLASADEAEAMVASRDPRTVARWFHARGVGVVVVKDGAQGAWASDGGEILLAPARPVRAVDPVGAGDAFAAGFISALLDGGDLRAALDSATVVAASAVQFAGDTAGLPSRAERDAMLRDDPHAEVRR